MKKLKLFFFLFLFAEALSAQISFQKIIGNANASYPRDIIQLLDTNYLICGSSSGYGDFTSNGFLMKIDQLGNFLWTKSFGGNNADWAMELVENADSTIVFAGYTNSAGNGGYDIWVVKTNSSGTVLWEKTYGGADWDFGNGIIKTSDGGYMISGETFSYGAGNKDAFLLKLDMNGDSLWMKTYGGTGNDDAQEVIETAGARYAFIGSTTSSPATISDIWLVKTDETGNELWQKRHGTLNEDHGKSLTLSKWNGDIILSGDIDTVAPGNTDMLYMRTDSTGNWICYAIYGLPAANNEISYDVAERWNGFGLLAGQTFSYGQGQGDMQINFPDVNCQWTGGPSYGTILEDDARAVKETLDSGFIAVGNTKTGPGLANILVVKVDGNFGAPPAITTYFDITSTAEIEESEIVYLFPNPAQKSFRLSTGKPRNGTLLIFEINGGVVHSEANYCSGNELRHNLSAGVYFVQFLESSGDYSVTKRLVIIP